MAPVTPSISFRGRWYQLMEVPEYIDRYMFVGALSSLPTPVVEIELDDRPLPGKPPGPPKESRKGLGGSVIQSLQKCSCWVVFE